MTIRGLNTIFKHSIKTLKTEGVKKGSKQILQGVRKEGGRTSTVFCGIGLVAGIIAPAAIVSAPLLGYSGAVLGRLLSNGVRASLKLGKNSLNMIL